MSGAAHVPEPLAEIVERNQVWSRMAAKYGVENPVPPWKTSLDGMCDALDRTACDENVPDFKQRHDEEDELSATVYSNLLFRRTSWCRWRIR